MKTSIGDCDLNVHVSGDGQPLLLVHGFPLDHTMWQAQIDALADRCHVIAPDLRGFGGSGTAGDVLTMQALADDLAALLDAMSIDRPVVLCGLSMGGYVAWQFLQRHPGRLAKLVLCDTRAAADSHTAAQGRLAMAERVLKEGPAFVAETMLPKLFAERARRENPAVVEATRRVILATAPATIAAAQRGMAQRSDATPMLPQIRLPTLLICGREDAITPLDEMRGVAQAIPGAQLVEVAGAGHMAPLEAPDEVNAALRRFLQD
jgi:pimeloyl-ACP methyl ester carboxylesterase